MMISRKALLAALAGATLLAGCATGPYYDDPGYGYDRPGYGYDNRYYNPGYVGPSVGLGLTYSDRDYRNRRGDHRDRDWRRDRDERYYERNYDRRDRYYRGGDPLYNPNYSPG